MYCRSFINANLYANGKLYWLSVHKYRLGQEHVKAAALLSLDIATEEFNIVASGFPEPYPKRTSYPTHRLASNGRFYHVHYQSPNTMEIWVLDNFDNPVWTRQRAISLPCLGYDVDGDEYLVPVAILDGEEYLIMAKEWTEMFACDMRSGEWREIAMVDFDQLAPPGGQPYYVCHTDSLISWTK
ncbi:hypothetical protein CRG98_003144 [Punica granatum]|uniref:Uncharacterized protein n=1 Tax=Punica granatum TaxID=22663 RepID=A0A2I0L750_PUNGR|nr:hypothetical protein CRG98_003144 [Punica granatum]